MKPRLCFLTLILVTIVFSISYAQNGLYNKKIKQLSLIQIEKGIPEKKGNKVAQYFNGIARDVFNDGIHSVTHIPGTFKNMFTIPFRRENRIYTGISLGFLGSCFIFDQNLYDLGKNQSWWPYKRKWHPGEPAKLPVILPIYSNLEWFESHFIAFAEYGYGVGLLIRNARLRNLCFNLMQATAYSFVLTRGIKSLCGRARPGDGGPMDWGHLHLNTRGQTDYDSFPSFHATFYTTYCTVLMDYIGCRWAGPILSSALLIYSTTDADSHWFSDAVAGVIFGYWLGAGIVEKSKSNTQKSSGISFTVSPLYKGISFHLIARN